MAGMRGGVGVLDQDVYVHHGVVDRTPAAGLDPLTGGELTERLVIAGPLRGPEASSRRRHMFAGAPV